MCVCVHCFSWALTSGHTQQLLAYTSTSTNKLTVLLVVCSSQQPTANEFNGLFDCVGARVFSYHSSWVVMVAEVAAEAATTKLANKVKVCVCSN